MVKKMDDNILALLVALESRGILDDTTIIFLGDNGTPTDVTISGSPDGIVGGDDDVKGEKSELTRRGLGVPLLVGVGG